MKKGFPANVVVIESCELGSTRAFAILRRVLPCGVYSNNRQPQLTLLSSAHYSQRLSMGRLEDSDWPALEERRTRDITWVTRPLYGSTQHHGVMRQVRIRKPKP